MCFFVGGGWDHQREVEFVAAFVGEPDTDHAGGVADEEGDLFLCRCFGGHDQITFVLAVLVIRDNDDLATGDRGDRVVDRIEQSLSHQPTSPG